MNFFPGRAAANSSSRAKRAGRKTAPGREAPQSFNRRAKRAGALFLAALLATVLAACGVKNQLVKPDGQATPKSERDPSQPPTPTGR